MQATLGEARDELRAAVKAAAGGDWDRKPEGSSATDAPSAREAAEAVVRAHLSAAEAVCVACGYPGPEQFEPLFATAADAEAGLERAIELSHGRLKYVSQNDLSIKHEQLGSVEQIIAADAAELRRCAAQIRAAAGV
jgi:hypothetical protein